MIFGWYNGVAMLLGNSRWLTATATIRHGLAELRVRLDAFRSHLGSRHVVITAVRPPGRDQRRGELCGIWLRVIEFSDNFEDMDTGKITRQIRERISGGEWAPGEQIDTFDTLMERYSLPTVYRVRQVLRPLIEEGLLESRHGSGTYVLRQPAPDPEPAPDPVQAARDLLDQAATEIADLRRRIDAARGHLARAC